MTPGVLDLNDIGLLFGDASGVLAQSPAYATLTATGVVVGEAARARSRLDPRQTISQFWQRLGTEPLPHAPPHTRHHADLAYAHLLHLHEQGGKPAEIVLAVPGSFSREQLAILLGIAARCPFRAIGLVDSALAAASDTAFAGSALHLELHLHQCVLTRIEHDGAVLVRTTVRVLAGVGLAQLNERWARRVAANFIQQTRFDPLHAAAVEQQLYDQLPAWLAALETQDDVAAELQHAGSRYRVSLRASDMLEAVQPLYAQIREATGTEAAGASLLLGARAARLPRLLAQLPGAVALPLEAALRGALLHLQHIRSEEPALRFVTRLPAPPAIESSAVAPAATPMVPQGSARAPPPTHLLSGNRALRLPVGQSFLYRANGTAWQLATELPGIPPACVLRHDGTSCWLQPEPGAQLQLDRTPVSSSVRIDAGARLSLDGDSELLFITEVAAEGDGT